MRVELPEYAMAYTDNGRGLPVLFVHGYPLNRQLWAPQVDGLSSAARIIAPDLRGHGESPPIPGPYPMELLADDLAAFLDALQISAPIVLCGLSMGGYVSFAFYRKYPQRLAGLILAATRAAADSPEGRQNRDHAAEKARQEGVRAVADGMLPKLLSPQTLDSRPELVEQVRNIMYGTSLEGMLGDLMGMKQRPDSTPLLAEIACPTLVIAGADDQVIPVTEAENMYAAIPNARLQILPHAGHLLNLEQPEAFNAIVDEFLQRF